MDFVSERLHCWLVLCACSHDGSETVVLITLRATLSLSGTCPGFTASNAVHSDSQLALYVNPRQTFHTLDEDSHVIDSFPGVVPVRGCAVLNGILQL